jgi:hypothetical protein
MRNVGGVLRNVGTQTFRTPDALFIGFAERAERCGTFSVPPHTR